jgi:DNA-binding transcriptional regulator YhcF (GntR family)
MDYRIHIDQSSKTTKLRQITQKIMHDIEKGILEKGTRVPSITAFSRSHKIARETVEKAYNLLKKEGYLEAVPGKGNFVNGVSPGRLKVLIILNKMSSYKKEVYDTFISTLGKKAQVDIQIYHYDPRLFRQIIEEHLGKYHYYAIMPHFFANTPQSEYLDVLSKIEPEELLILDRKLPGNKAYVGIYQDFRLDIYGAFMENASLFNKYSSLTVIFPEMSNHPPEIITGIQDFCEGQGMGFTVVADVKQLELSEGSAYITLTEADLAILIKAVWDISFTLGKEVGVISFNETALKELLEITVVTTDFSEMGRRAAEMILERKFESIRNSFRFIKRLSL